MENLVFSLKFLFKLAAVILTGSGSVDDASVNNLEKETVKTSIIQYNDSAYKMPQPTLVLDSLNLPKSNYERKVKLATDGI